MEYTLSSCREVYSHQVPVHHTGPVMGNVPAGCGVATLPQETSASWSLRSIMVLLGVLLGAGLPLWMRETI